MGTKVCRERRHAELVRRSLRHIEHTNMFGVYRQKHISDNSQRAIFRVRRDQGVAPYNGLLAAVPSCPTDRQIPSLNIHLRINYCWCHSFSIYDFSCFNIFLDTKNRNILVWNTIKHFYQDNFFCYRSCST